ncbi:hypothetical protein M758_6G055900 [Ceratodon purpureus]|uniref:Uncharacterized protein n=1 Tax=Ceratodon purpureus TaxID=3225 RepID=A0A8T0HCM3_CERPU|nr:hypothetical protein KC19_6G059700 [Ceratodon purpureus]KAG0612837.1 hypothetical protein M758_6G055900 [Ceratodon purpureus]
MKMERRNDVYRSSGNSDLANGGRAKSTKMARSGSWLQTDPETRRKKRVAKYKVFSVEAKVKQTVRNSCRWIKAKFFEVRYGWY